MNIEAATKAQAETAADEALSLIGDESDVLTYGQVRAALVSTFKQAVEWTQQQQEGTISSVLDEALNTGDGSYRP